MPGCSFSETQFAFAYLKQYLDFNSHSRLRFVLPSIKLEGNASSIYCGSDLIINDSTFFQFKLPNYLTRKSAREIKNSKLNSSFLNYYRFRIKNDHPSKQFDTLLRMASNPINKVYYITPLFITDRDYYNFYYYDNPSKALKYTFALNFNYFINNKIILSHTNKHVLCYKGTTASSIIRVFSDEYGFEANTQIPKIEFKEKLPEREIESRKLNNYLNIMKETINLEFNERTIIDNIQRDILFKYNILWIPIFQNNI